MESSWQKYLSEKKSYEKKDKNKSKKETSAMKRKAADKIIKDLAKKGEKEKKESEYTSYLKQQLEFKKQKYADQQKRQAEKSKDAGKSDEKQAKKHLDAISKGQTIYSKDKGSTATQKALSNAGNIALNLAAAARHGLKARKKKKEAEEAAKKSPEKKEPGTPGRPRGEDKPKTETKPDTEQKALPGTKVKGLLPPESRQKAMRRRLPPSSEGGSRVGQPSPGSRPQLPGSMKKRMIRSADDGAKRVGQPGPDRVGKPAPERPALKPSVNKRRMLKPSSEGESRVGQPAAGSRTEPTVGQRARQNPALRAKLTRERGGSVDYSKAKRKVLGLEGYSNWRSELSLYEEYLSEVEEKKKTKKDIIDIMKGKNTVILNPMEEEHKKVSSGEMKDDEGYMAKSQLQTMERAIKALNKKIKRKDDQLPAWVQSKITKATDHIDTASDYMQSEVKEELEVLLAQKLMEAPKPPQNDVGYRLGRGLTNALRDLPSGLMGQLTGRDNAALQRQRQRGQTLNRFLTTGSFDKPTTKPTTKPSPTVQQQIDRNTRDRQTMNPEDYFGTRVPPTKPTTGGLTPAQREAKLRQQRAETMSDPRARRELTGSSSSGNVQPVRPVKSSAPAPAPKPSPAQQANAKYDQLRKTDPAAARKFGMETWAKANPTLANKKKTPNPLMKDMPGRNKAELETLRGNAAINSISQSPSAKRILSGNARSATANRIGQQSLNRSEFGSATKPKPTPAIPAQTRQTPQGPKKFPAASAPPPPPASTQKPTIKSSVEYPEMMSVLEQIQGGLWEAKKSEMKCNKPRAEAHGSGETGKSHVVKACEGGEEKLIRFGQLGVKGSPKKEGESEEYASRRRKFKTRHAKNIARGRMSAAYWANKVKW